MPKAPPAVMHPHDFEVNQLWLAFRANQLPIMVGDEPSDVFVLQDAASLYIFGTAFAPSGAESPSEQSVEELLSQGWSKLETWPSELVLSGRPSVNNAFRLVAKRLGLHVRSVPEAQMSFHIKDVQEAMEEFLARNPESDA
jgi:hypothetical protein